MNCYKLDYIAKSLSDDKISLINETIETILKDNEFSFDEFKWPSLFFSKKDSGASYFNEYSIKYNGYLCAVNFVFKENAPTRVVKEIDSYLKSQQYEVLSERNN